MNGPSFYYQVTNLAKQFAEYLEKNPNNKYYVVLVIITKTFVKDNHRFLELLK